MFIRGYWGYLQHLPGGDVPEPDEVVRAGSVQGFALRISCQGRDGSDVGLQGLKQELKLKFYYNTL